MNVTYINHSCFLIELEYSYILFDYYKGELPNLSSYKTLYIMNSHMHADHFSFSIFTNIHHPKVIYILSDDIRHKYSLKSFVRRGVTQEIYSSIYFVKAHERYEIGDLVIETLLSTDLGVAFIVSAEEISMLHAGDLQWWHWPLDNEHNNDAMETAFKREISSIQGRHFDVAFLVLDPRQKEAFYMGFDYIMNNVDISLAYPMHCWGDYYVIDRIKNMDISNTYRDKIVNYY